MQDENKFHKVSKYFFTTRSRSLILPPEETVNLATKVTIIITGIDLCHGLTIKNDISSG